MVLLRRNTATINAHVKTKNRSNTGSDTLTRDPTRPDRARPDPAKIANPVTNDPEIRFHI